MLRFKIKDVGLKMYVTEEMICGGLGRREGEETGYKRESNTGEGCKGK